MMGKSSVLETTRTTWSNLNSAFHKQKAKSPVPGTAADPTSLETRNPSELDKVVIRYSQSLATNLIFHLSER